MLKKVHNPLWFYSLNCVFLFEHKNEGEHPFMQIQFVIQTARGFHEDDLPENLSFNSPL